MLARTQDEGAAQALRRGGRRQGRRGPVRPHDYLPDGALGSEGSPPSPCGGRDRSSHAAGAGSSLKRAAGGNDVIDQNCGRVDCFFESEDGRGSLLPPPPSRLGRPPSAGEIECHGETGQTADFGCQQCGGVDAIPPAPAEAARDGSQSYCVGRQQSCHRLGQWPRRGGESVVLQAGNQDPSRSGMMKSRPDEQTRRKAPNRDLLKFGSTPPAKPIWAQRRTSETDHLPTLRFGTDNPGRARLYPRVWWVGTRRERPALVLCLGNSVRVSARPRRSRPGRTTKAQPMRCVEEEDVARGVVGRRDPTIIHQTVH